MGDFPHCRGFSPTPQVISPATEAFCQIWGIFSSHRWFSPIAAQEILHHEGNFLNNREISITKEYFLPSREERQRKDRLLRTMEHRKWNKLLKSIKQELLCVNYERF
jgi:hypothetical protein